MEQRICVICGKPIPSWSLRVRYCCEECARESDRIRKREHAKTLKPKVCIRCGNTYRPHGKDQRYCSPACAGKDYQKPAKTRVELHPSDTVRIRILDDIMVHQDMEPVVGAVYEAEKPFVYRGGTQFYVIHNMNGTGKKLVVRENECEEV